MRGDFQYGTVLDPQRAADYRGEPSPFRWPSVSSSFGAMDLCGFPSLTNQRSNWAEDGHAAAAGSVRGCQVCDKLRPSAVHSGNGRSHSASFEKTAVRHTGLRWRERARSAPRRGGSGRNAERGRSVASCATTATCADGLDAIADRRLGARIPVERLREIELGPTSTCAEFAGLATARSQRPRGQSTPALATSDYRIDSSTRPVPSHRQVAGNLKRLSLYRYRRRR